MRLQSSLGDVKYGGREDVDNHGKLVIGTVTRVYDKNGSADVMLQSGSFMGDNQITNGIVNSCIQLENFSGYDEETDTYYGDYTPLQVGQRVVIAFIGSEKYKPIIIGNLPTWNKNKTNVNPRIDAYGEGAGARGESCRVNLDQSYSYKNGNGEYEEVESSCAFTVGKIHKMSDHREDGFNFQDLTLRNKNTNKTIQHDLHTSLIVPFNYLRVTKDTVKDSTKAKYNRWYHDAQLGITRYSQDTPNFLFTTGIDEDQNFEIRVQPKTYKRLRRDNEPRVYDRRTLRKSESKIMKKFFEENPNPEMIPPDIEEFTNFRMEKDGTLSIFRQTEKGQTKLSFTDEGIVLETSEDVDLKTEQKVKIQANKDVEVNTKGDVNLNSEKSINLSANERISLNAPKIVQYKEVNVSVGEYDSESMRFKDPGETGTGNKNGLEW